MTDFTKDLKNQSIKVLLEIFKNSSGRIKKAIGDLIKEKIKSKNYLLSISEEETTKIYEVTKTDIYRRMENCLGGHWSMNLIALGIYVAELNKKQQEEIVQKIGIKFMKNIVLQE